MNKKEKIEAGRIRARIWYKNNREKALKNFKEYRKNNKEKLKITQHNHYLKNKKKISLKLFEYREKNKLKVSLQQKKWYEKNKSYVIQRMIKYNRTIKQKRKARGAVSTALISGKLKKDLCEICKSKNVQAHHTDYSKPLKVNWLCRKHHYLLHRKYRNGDIKQGKG